MKKFILLVVILSGTVLQGFSQSTSEKADRIGLIGFWRMMQMNGHSEGEDFSQELDGSRFYIFKDNGICQYSTSDRKIADAKWTLKGKELHIWGKDTANDPDGIDYTFELVMVTPQKLILKLSGGESYVYSTFRKANASLKQISKPYTSQNNSDSSAKDSGNSGTVEKEETPVLDNSTPKTPQKSVAPVEAKTPSREPAPAKPLISTTINKSDVYFSRAEAKGSDVEIVCWLNPRINGTRIEAMSVKYEQNGKLISKQSRVSGYGGKELPRDGNVLNRGNRVNHGEKFYVTATIKNVAHLHSLKSVYIRVWTSYGEGDVIIKDVKW